MRLLAAFVLVISGIAHADVSRVDVELCFKSFGEGAALSGPDVAYSAVMGDGIVERNDNSSENPGKWTIYGQKGSVQVEKSGAGCTASQGSVVNFFEKALKNKARLYKAALNDYQESLKIHPEDSYRKKGLDMKKKEYAKIRSECQNIAELRAALTETDKVFNVDGGSSKSGNDSTGKEPAAVGR